MSISLTKNVEPYKIWFEPLGKLVINFGTIECFVNSCLGDDYDESKYSIPFSKRVGKLINDIDDLNITDEDKSNYKKLLEDILELFKIRNTIMHSPIIKGKTKDEGTDLLVFIDVSNQRTITLSQLYDIIDQSNRLGTSLNEFLDFLKSQSYQ